MDRKKWIIAAIVFQIAILAGMLVKAILPLYTGTEITLKVVPRDPRDIFRGNYVALNYEFTQLHLDSIPNDLDTTRQYHFGDRLYLRLQPEGDVYRPAGLYQQPGAGGEGIYMKVLVKHYARYGARIWLTAGIESFFTDPASAAKLATMANGNTPEDSLQIPLTVAVMVAPDGTARIKRVNIPAL